MVFFGGGGGFHQVKSQEPDMPPWVLLQSSVQQCWELTLGGSTGQGPSKGRGGAGGFALYTVMPF